LQRQTRSTLGWQHLLLGVVASVDFAKRCLQVRRMKYRVVIEPDEDGVFVAECPVLPVCISQGKTRAEALANIKEAMTEYLASLKKHGEPAPPPISEEIVEIPA
jgi:antitoxin HicB